MAAGAQQMEAHIGNVTGPTRSRERHSITLLLGMPMAPVVTGDGGECAVLISAA